MGMGDKWDRHPCMDGLRCGVEVARLPAGPGGEDDRARDRQQEGEPDSQRALPRFSHDPNIAGSRSIALTEAVPERDFGVRLRNAGSQWRVAVKWPVTVKSL